MSGAKETLRDVLQSTDASALLPAGGPGPITASQLREAVLNFARTLRSFGVRRGDVVSIAEANTVRPVSAISHL